ncbi:uncharacterized protein [Venturia canescens]|uniref:uncharacterized protein isoform X2 n=1 Tax=Venturia canescens TaxID=32260 RepID=UPI001C9CDAAF|nr:uncharacterized protein LOC122408357 isoform X2 [Venturia canescens]
MKKALEFIVTARCHSLFQSGLSETIVASGYSTFDDACLVESGLSRDQFMERVTDVNIKLLANENILCYLLCVGKKVGYMHNDGTINVEYIRNYVGPTMSGATMRALGKCSEKRNENACQTLRMNYTCVFEMMLQALLDSLKVNA